VLPTFLIFGRVVAMRLGIFVGKRRLTVDDPPSPDSRWEDAEIYRLTRTLRSRRTATQADLAPRIGVSKRSLNQYESGRLYPRPTTFVVWTTELASKTRWTRV
jgi:DNA-binding XRE family transcriptional regulator